MTIGTTDISAYKMGSTGVSRIYLGNELIYPITPINYIETDGSSYIDISDLKPSNLIYTTIKIIRGIRYNSYHSFAFEMKYMFPNVVSGNYILGADGGDDYWFSIETNGGNTYMNFGSNVVLVPHETSYNTPLIEKYTCGYSYIEWSGEEYTPITALNLIKNDGTIQYGGQWMGNTTSHSTALFGAFNHAGQWNQLAAQPGQRIYYFKLWKKNFMISEDRGTLINNPDELILDLKPAFYNGQACLRDTLSGNYYTNQGTGTFIYGW